MNGAQLGLYSWFVCLFVIFSIEKMCLIQCLILNKHLYLSSDQLGLDLETNIKKTYVQKNWTTCSNLLTMLDAIVNIMGGGYMTI